jgi:hypothetical protein
MSLQSYLLSLKMSTLFVFFAWASVVLYINPEEAGVFGKSLFFGTLFLWLMGVFVLCLTFMQRSLQGEERAANALGEIMRRGFLLALWVLALCLFQAWQLLALWIAALLATALLLIELRFVHLSESAWRETKSASQSEPSPMRYARVRHKGLV